MIIRIKNLRLSALIGVNDWERDRRQALILNAEIEFDGQPAGRSDNIDDTIDYSALVDKLTAYVESSRYYLLEALATNLLELIMADERVSGARLEIDKPMAIGLADSASVEVAGRR